MAHPKNPRLSVNKLGEYLVVGPARRHRILYDAKFPSEAIVAYYQPAADAIAQFISGSMADVSVIEGKMELLGKSNPDTIWQQRRSIGNIDALETFLSILDDIDLQGAKPSLGAHSAAPVVYKGVAINVRPELVLEGAKNSVGGIKLHFPKTNPLSQISAGYVSALTHEYCTQHLTEKGNANPKLCMVIDIASGKFFPGPSSTKAKLKDINAACTEVASIWPTIQP